MATSNFTIAPTYQIALLKSQVYRAMSSYLAQALAPYAITPPEWMLVGCLYENGEMLPTELATAMGVKPPVVTASLKSLQGKKIIRKDRSSNDGRFARVTLTLKGKQIIAKAETHMQRDLQKFVEDIAPSDLQAYNRVLLALFTKINGA